MRNAIRLFAVFTLVLALATPAGAAPLKKLAKKLQKGLKGQENRKVAVLSFAYPKGAVSSGSTIVAERLTTYLAQGGKVEVIERNLLDKVLAEMKLETTGVIDEKTTHELGKVLGVGAIVTGTLNDLKKGRTEVNARLIQTQTGKVLAAGLVKVKRTWEDAPVIAKPPIVRPPDVPDRPDGPDSGSSLVQLAVLLDTSNSMDGLIDQAKTQLWKIVNELSSSEGEGDTPALQVALFEYGNSNLSRGEHYVRQVLPFTADLDKISEELFALKTNGGQEYCGAVIQDAVRGLEWSKESDVYKVVFIAGNEPFTQGPVPFRVSVAEAKSKGIFVNAIFCGSRQQGIATKWMAGANMSGGEYVNIDQDRKVVAVRSPQDSEIERLGRELNNTYIPYGSRGRKEETRRRAQDRAASSHAGSGAFLQRSLFKSKRQYSRSASRGDAASMVESGEKKVSDLDEAALPAEMRKMSVAEREKHIRVKIKRRKDIQSSIRKLNLERKRYIAEEQRRQTSKSGAMSLDQAMIEAIRTQRRR